MVSLFVYSLHPQWSKTLKTMTHYFQSGSDSTEFCPQLSAIFQENTNWGFCMPPLMSSVNYSLLANLFIQTVTAMDARMGLSVLPAFGKINSDTEGEAEHRVCQCRKTVTQLWWTLSCSLFLCFTVVTQSFSWWIICPGSSDHMGGSLSVSPCMNLHL